MAIAIRCLQCGILGCPGDMRCPAVQQSIATRQASAHFALRNATQNALLAQNVYSGMLGIPTEPSNPLENAGMKVEDLIGWRIWTYKQGYLWAYSQDYAWMPGDVAEGEPGDHDHAGIWAFKEKRRAFQKAVASGRAHVWGSVRLWGHVVEHADGFRAAKARIVSIEGGVGVDPDQMATLCETYGVPMPKMATLHSKMLTAEKAHHMALQAAHAEVSAALEIVNDRPDWKLFWCVVASVVTFVGLIIIACKSI